MFWYYEVYFPARYAFAGVPFLVILCARALVLAGARVRRSRWPWLRPVAVTVVASCVLFTVGFSTPLHLRGYNGHYGDVESVLPQVVRAQGLTHAVVFVDAVGYGLGDVDPNNSYYGTGFMLNDLDLTNDVIYARNSRRYNPLIRQVYPDRSYYLYRYVRDANRACLYRMLPAGDEFR